MKGFSSSSTQRAERPPAFEGGDRLAAWEALAVDAVGSVIEFWGFKRNQGRVWALLYVRGEALSARQLEEELGLSKGAVSMLVRDLERWGVLHRARPGGDGPSRFMAQTQLLKMVSRVIEDREARFLRRIREDLTEARRLALAHREVPAPRLLRLEKMAQLAEQTDRALRLFIRTAKLDVSGMFSVFRDG